MVLLLSRLWTWLDWKRLTDCRYLEKKGGGGLISIEDCVESAIRGLEEYVHGSEEKLIQTARADKIDGLEAASVLNISKEEKRLEDWE